MTIHEETTADTSFEFVGLEFDGIPGDITVKKKRLWRLAYALEEAISRGSMSGHGMEVLVGHITWALMVRREALCLLNLTYSFASAHPGNDLHPLWPGVVEELWRIRCLLPLLRARVKAPWHDRCMACDASTFGLGACERDLDLATARSLGRTSERWRYRVEDAVRARARALGLDCQGGDELPSEIAAESQREMNGAFREVPPDFLKGTQWRNVHASRIHFPKNILNLEGQAAAWSWQHIVRASQSFGRRILVHRQHAPGP